MKPAERKSLYEKHVNGYRPLYANGLRTDVLSVSVCRAHVYVMMKERLQGRSTK